MSIGSFGRICYPPNRIVHQVTPSPLRISKDWRSAFVYLLPPLLVVVRLTVLIRRRSGTDFADVDVHAGIEVALVMITCLVLVASRRTRLVLGRASRMSIGMLLVYYGFAGLSAAWSAMPEYSAYRALESASQLIAIVVGISCFKSFLKAEKAVLILGVLVALLGVAGTARLWHFTTLRTNQYTAGASMVLCYCFAEMPRAIGRRRSMLIVSASIGSCIVAVGLCATSNVATFVGLLSGAVFARNRTGLIFVIMLLVVALILVPGLASDIWETAKDVLLPGKSDAQIRDLHGRVSMWEQALAEAKTRPFIGHGFGIKSRLQGATSAHNAFVQIFLDTGMIGVLLFSLSGLMFLGEVVQRWNIASIGLAGCVAAFISALLHLMTGILFGSQWLAPSFTFAAFVGFYMHHIYCRANSTQ